MSQSPSSGSAVGQLLGGEGVPTGVGIAIGTVLALVFATLVQMVFGDSFHIMDPDWGHVAIKMSGHPPLKRLVIVGLSDARGTMRV